MVSPKFISPLRCATLMAAAMMIAGGSPDARAANIFWDGNGTTTGIGSNGTWATSGNTWVNNGATATNPTGTTATTYPNNSADVAYFAGTTGTVTLNFNPSLAGLVFRNAAFTLTSASAQNITLGTSGIALEASSGLTTFNANVGLIVGGNQAWTNSSANALVVNGVVSGSGTLTLGGAGAGGIRLLNTANTFDGLLTLAAGSLRVTRLANGGVNSSLGSATLLADSLTFGSNTTLAWVGDGVPGVDATNRLFTVSAGNFTLDASAAAGETLQFTNTSALGKPLAPDTIDRVFTLTGSSGTSATPNVFAPIIPDNGGLDGGSIYVGKTGLTKDGTGTWRLTGANTFAGPVLINQGTLAITRLALGGVASGLGLSGAGSTGNLVIGSATAVGTLRFEGSGALHNRTDRMFTIGQMGAVIDASGAVGAPMLLRNYAALTMAGTGSRTLTLTGTNTDYNFLGQTMADPTGGTFSLVKDGPGTWQLDGSSTYTGGTVINAGVLRISTGARVLGTGTVTINGGVLDLGTQTIQSVNPPPGNSYFLGIVTLAGGELAATAGGMMDAARVIPDSGRISAELYGSGAFVKSNAGTVVLSAYNLFTGGASLAAGKTEVANAFAFGDQGARTLTLSGGALSSASTSSYVLPNNVTISADTTLGDAVKTGQLTFAGTTDLGASTRTLTVQSGIVFRGQVSGAGGLTKAGLGVLTLSAANNFSGGTVVNAGRLRVGNNTALGSAGLALNNGSAFSSAGQTGAGVGDYTLTNALTLGGDVTLGDLTDNGVLTLNGAVTLGSSVTRIATVNSQVILGGIISGTTASLTKSGPGTLVLSGNNTFNGALTLNTGILRATTSAGALGAGNLALTGGVLQLANDTALNFGRATSVSGAALIVADRLTAGSGVVYTFGPLALGSSVLNLTAGSTVNSGATGVTFGATTLSAGATILTSNSFFAPSVTNTTTLASLAGNFALTVGGAGNLTVTGGSSATTSTLTKNGAGTLTLGSAGGATYASSGLMTITGGSVVVGAGTTFTAATRPPLTFAGSGRFQFTAASAGTVQTLGALTFSAGSGVVQSQYGSSGNAGLTFASLSARAIGADALFVASGGTSTTNRITLTGQTANAFVGGAATSFFARSFPATTISPADFAFTDTNGFVRAVDWMNDTGFANRVGSVESLATARANSISGASGNSGVVTQPSAVTILGLAFIGPASLAANALVTTPSVLVSGGTTATISGTVGLTTGSASDLVVRVDTTSDSLTISAPITGSTTGGLTKSGLGTLVLSGANAFTGNLYVNGGTLSIGGSAYDRAEPATGPLGAGVTGTPRQIILNGGTFQLSSGVFNPNANTNLFQVGTAGGTIAVGANAALRLDDAGQLAGGGDVIFNGGSGSVFTVSNANLGFTGNVNVTGGTLTLGHANALGSAGQVLSLSTNVAALDLQGVIPQVVWFGGSGVGGTGVLRSTLTGGGISGPIFLTSSATINNSQPLVLSGAITEVGGTFSLTKTGNGVLTLSGANVYTGDTTVSNGVLRLGHTQAAGPGSEPINLSSTALGTAVQLTGGITVFNPLNTGATNQLFGGVDFGGALQNFSGNNTYAGVISMAIDTSIGSAAGVLTLTGGIREITKQSQLYFTGAGDIVLAGTKITTEGGPTNSRFHSIQKFGAGTLTVTNAQDIALDGGVNGGAFILRQGTVRLTGAGSWRSNLLLEPGSAMVVDHQDSLLTRVGRLSSAFYALDGGGNNVFNAGTSYNLHLRGGNFTLNGADSAGDTGEFFNNVTFGRGGSVITIRSAGLLSPTRLQFHNSITNNVASSQQGGPSGASLLIRGTNLGVSPGFASLRWNGIVTWNGQGGGIDTPNKGMMSWALVDSSESGTGASFATADGGSSYARALNQGVYAENSISAGQPYENEYSFVTPTRDFVPLANHNWFLAAGRSFTGEAFISANSLTVEPGASLTFAPGAAFFLQSGGVLIRSGAPLTTFTGGVINQMANLPPLYLWTLGNLDLVSTLNGGNGIANGNIGLVKAGAGVLALKPPFAAIGGLTTQGTNTYSGQMVINDGTVRLFADNAIQPNNFLALTAGSLDLNGRTQQILSLLSDNNVPGSAGTVVNSSATRGALVVNHDNNPRLWSGRIQGNTAFVRSGQNTLTLNSDLAFTGPAVFNAANTVLLSLGALSGAESLEIAYGTLILDNGGTATSNTAGMNYLGNRVRDAAPVSLRAGTFNIWGRSNVAAVENIGAVSAVAGFNVFNVNHGGNGAVFSQDLRMASLTRPVGSAATLIIQSNATLGGTGTGDARALATSFDGGAGLANNIVGGWAINGADFLTYTAARGFFALGAHGTSYTSTSLLSGSNPNANVRLTSTATVQPGTTTLNALSLAGASQNLQFTNVDDILNLVSGGFIGTNNSNLIGTSVDSGRLTAGGSAATGTSDLYLFNRANTLTLNSRVVNNPAGALVRLVLTASGGAINLTNTAASYSGGTVVNGGTINLLASASGVVIPASANGLVLNGATVNQGSQSNVFTGQIAATNVVTLNGSSNLNLLGDNTLAGLVFNNLGGTGNPNVRTFSNNHPIRTGATGVLTLGGAGIVATSQNVGTVATVEGRLNFGAGLGLITVDPISVGGMTDVSPLRPGLALQAIVGSTGGIRKDGAGVLQLGAQSQFTSGFNVAAGGLRNGVLNAGSRFSALTIASGARYDLNNFSTTWGSLAGGGDIFNSFLVGVRPQVAPTLSVGWNALSTDSTIFSGRLQRFNDAVMFNFTKVGAGTLAMTSAQDTAGSFGMISVQGGTLSYVGAGRAFVATDTQASGLTVSTNGTLFLDNVSGNVDSRLGLADAGILIMQGGLLRIQGNALADTVEEINLLRVVTAGGRIELQPHASRGLDLALGNFSVPNNSGSLVIAGIDGRDSGPGIAALTVAGILPYQIGQGSGSLNGDRDLPVRGDILADASRTGLGTGFLVMDTVTGSFRALAVGELRTDLALLQTGENFGLNGTLTYGADLRMNTLTSTVGTRSLTPSLNATVFGAYGPGGTLLDLGLTGASAVLVPSGSTTTLGAGSLTTEGTAYFHVLGTGTLNLNASVGVGDSASFVKAGAGRLNLNRRAYFAPLSLRNGFTVEESDELTVDSTAGVSIGSLVTGPGIPGSTFVTEIISSARVRISSGEGVTTSGPGTYLLQPIVSVNGGQLFLNSGSANTFAVAALPGPAGLSALFVNTSDSLVDLMGQDQAIGTLGSVNFLPGAGGTVTNSATGPVVRLTSAAAGSFGGSLTGNLAFTRSGSGTTLLTSPQTYVGETVVRGGTLQLRDAGTLASTAGLQVFYGAVNWDNYGLNPSASPTPTRIQANNALTLRGGAFVLTGGGSTDTVVTLNSVSATGGGNLINLQPYANSGATMRLNIGNLQRSATNFPTFNLNGWTTQNSGGVNTLGSQGLSNTANLYIGQINGSAGPFRRFFSNATTTPDSATITVGSTAGLGLLPGMTVSGIPGLVTGVVQSVGATTIVLTSGIGVTASSTATIDVNNLTNGLIGGWAIADGNAFATYTNEFGVVSLGSGWGYTTSFTGSDISAATVSTGNYNDGTSRTLSSGVKAMNSLRMSPGAAQNITPAIGTTYEFGVGIVTNANQTITFETVDATNTLRGTGDALYLFVNQNNLVLRPIITGTAALVSFGGATLQLAPQRGHNLYTGGTFVNAGTLNLNASPRVSRGGLTITTANRTTIAMGDTSGFTVGMTITNGNFPAGTRITGINPNVSLTIDTPHTAGWDQGGQTVSSFLGWYAVPAAGGLTINNAAVTMSAGVFQQIEPGTAVTINGGGSLTLPNYALGTASVTNVLTQTFGSLTFVNDGGANTPTFNLGNPGVVAATVAPLSITEFTSATPITATNDSLSTTPQVITGNAGNTQLRFSAANPVITVNAGLAETGLVIGAVIGQSATMMTLTKSGPGILALAGENLFSANFILNQGGVLVAANFLDNNGEVPDAGPLGSGTLIINGGFLLGDGLARIVRNPVTVAAHFDFGGNVATNNLTLGGPVAFGSLPRSIGVLSPAVTATISGPITSTLSSGFALTKTGPGVLALSGVNSFNGNGVDVAGGVLRVAAVGAIPAATPIQVAAGAGLDLNGFDLSLVRITGGGFVTNSFAGQSILTLGGAASFTFSGSFIDNAGFDAVSTLQVTKVGAGTMTLRGESFNTGGLFVEAGVVELGAGGLTTRGGQVDIGNTGTPAVFRVNRTDTFELSSIFTGSGDLRQVGTGTTVFTGDSSAFFGNVYVEAGALHLGDDVQTTGDLGSASIDVANGTYLGFDRPNTYSFIGSISGAGGIRHLGMGTTTLQTPNTFTGSTIVDNGILVAGTSGSLRDTSSITLNAAELHVRANGAIGERDMNVVSTIAPPLTLRGGSALFDAGNFNSTIGFLTLDGGLIMSAPAAQFSVPEQGALNLVGNVDVQSNTEISAAYVNTDGGIRTITVASIATLTMSGSFADTDKDPTAYVKLGLGRLLLTGPNEQTGGITITAGVLQVGNGGVTGVLGSDTFNSVTTWSPVTNNASLILNRAGTYDMGNAISGTGTVRVSGPGTVVFAGNNQYTGVTTLAGGTAQVSSLVSSGGIGRLGAGSAPSQLLFSGGMLQYAGLGEISQRGFRVLDGGAGFSAIQSGATALQITGSAPIDFDNTPLGARPLRLTGTNTASNLFAPTPFESETAGRAFSSLTKELAGVWVLGRDDLLNADANVTVAGGTLGFVLNAFGGAGATSDVNILDGAALRWESGNTSDIAARLRVPAAATAALDFAGSAASTVTFASPLAVGTAANITKRGTGTLVLSVANPALTNELTVSDGRLRATHAGSMGTAAVTVRDTGILSVEAVATNNITVLSGGVLAGAGSVGQVGVSGSGVVSPGNGIGALAMSQLTLGAGSVLRWQVYETGGSAGVVYDTINLTGALSLQTATPANRIRLEVISVSALGTDTQGNAGFFVRGPTQNFRLAFAQGGVNWNLGSTSNVADLFDVNVDGFRYTDGTLSNANLWTVSYNGTDSLMLTSVPEPSTYGLGLGALGLAAAALRRRRRKA